MIASELRTMNYTELRDKARLAIAWAGAGTPVMVFEKGDPAAVLITNDETQRWIAVERSFSALHGLDVYPELAEDTSSLAALVAGRDRPNPTAIRRLAREPRQILDIPRVINVTEIQRRLAGILDEIADGRPSAIYSSGKHVGVFITPAEYYRLRKLSRVVSWFRTAGLDLAASDEAAIVEFVRRFREGPSSASESAVG